MGKPVTAWSYSRYDLFNLCPLKFKYRVIDGLPEPGSPAMERGDRVHKGLAKYILGQGELPPEVVTPFQQKLYAEMRTHDDKVVEQQWGFTRAWEPTGWFGKETWLRATLDAAFLYDDMVAEAVDHKTGKAYGSNDEQMELFALALMCHFKPVKHVITRLVYVDAGTEQKAEFAVADKAKLQAKWEAKARPLFEETQFIARPNDKCRWCAYAKSKGGQCRFG